MLKNPGESHWSHRRLIGLLLLIVAVLGIFAGRLFQIQIVQGDEYSTLADQSTKTTISIAASRGEILDCNQIPLVSNRTSYAITLDYNYFPHGNSEEQQEKENNCLLALVQLLQEQNESWNDTLPISAVAPYAFDAERENGVAQLKSYLRMASYATADNCMTQMIELYALDGYTIEQQRMLAGIRYEMIISEFAIANPYTFASGISGTTMYKILENNALYPGVDVKTVAVREYVSGTTACHIIGTVGPIYAEEYAELKEKGYSYNDTLGKSGIESAAEDYLRGAAGKRTLVKNSQGTVISEEETVSPTPGKTVVLSLDSNLQKVAQDALTEKITSLRAQSGSYGNGQDVKSGSVVVLDVKTGGVKVCASWPYYNLSTYTSEYNVLLNDPDKPLFNRALYGAFPCGSTFKPGVALAALTEGKITPSTVINCTRTYMYYAPSYTPSCMGHHGSQNVAGALRYSCNFFFYEVGRLMGSSLFSYLTLYGFGQKTGVEIGESSGVQQTPEYLQSIGSTWVPGDYLQLAIGQRGSYTPIQLAAYAMMIANDGVRYKTHFIQSQRSYDATSDDIIQPEVAATAEWSQTAIDAVRDGMVQVTKIGTARTAFGNVPYSIAGKTGTAETGINNTSDHGTFIAYAPVDNPEVAIAVVLERGTSHPATDVARVVMDAYFDSKEAGEPPTSYGILLP